MDGMSGLMGGGVCGEGLILGLDFGLEFEIVAIFF